MSSVGDASLSLLQSTVPSNHTSNVAIGIMTLILTGFMFLAYYTSPMRLTAILVDALHETEETHLRAIEAGILSGSDDHTKMLLNLQIKVSLIHEASLRHSLSSGQALRELMKGRSLTLFRCIWEVQALQTRIEHELGNIVKAEHLGLGKWMSCLQGANRKGVPVERVKRVGGNIVPGKGRLGLDLFNTASLGQLLGEMVRPKDAKLYLHPAPGVCPVRQQAYQLDTPSGLESSGN
ncbi:hypothetical protein B0H16DRAFT_1720541 [Mycena metata]|uniref:Uncharacterized protein n=1 Tax=Mycena metata TaxID=1033252 RepID=A0AAD7JBF9_9AGAR|nr:hypothetical protein B0H16DRAFT_1720541 [Mycena metata]